MAATSSASSAGPLSVSQVATGPATVGQAETFTITVTNTTSGQAFDVFLGDQLPAGARLTGPLPNPNLCAKGGSGGTQAFACLVGTLGAAGSGTDVFSITFSIIPSTTSIDNRAATTGFANGSFVSNSVDLVIALSGSTVTTTSTTTDVQVTGFASTGSPTAGSQFAYVYQVKNNGPLVASAVTFTDTLPADEGYIGAGNSVTGLCSNNAGTITCGLGDLAVGAQALVGIAVTAPTDLTFGSLVSDTGSASSATTPDSNLSNNSFTVTVKVQ
jgi:uncharacterized repeat protein (TIGR01451 family)